MFYTVSIVIFIFVTAFVKYLFYKLVERDPYFVKRFFDGFTFLASLIMIVVNFQHYFSLF